MTENTAPAEAGPARTHLNTRLADCVPTRSATSAPCLRRRRPSSAPRAWTRPRRRSPTWPASESERCTGISHSVRTWSRPYSSTIDACADAAPALAAAHEPGAALANWLHRYTEFLATKRGLATALHSGDPAFDALPGYFYQRLEPALGSLLDAAAATGEIRADISARDLLRAVALLCTPVSDEGIAYSQRMVTLLIDGLRYAAELQRSS